MQRQIPTIQTVLETVESPQVQFLDRMVDMPIVMQQKRLPARLCFSLDPDNGAPFHEERVVAVRRNVICILFSTSEMSQMECVNLFMEFKTARANAQNLSYRLKVSEFAAWTTSESVSRMECGHPGNFLRVFCRQSMLCRTQCLSTAQQCVEWPEAHESS